MDRERERVCVYEREREKKRVRKYQVIVSKERFFRENICRDSKR